MRRAAALWFAAVLAVTAGCTVQKEAPNLTGQDVRVTVIHTSDIHSRLFPYHFVPGRIDQDYGLQLGHGPYGGIARMGAIIKAERARAARSIWLDSGDCFQGAPVFNLYRGEAELRALTQLGLDAAVVGNHEFDMGANNLYEQAIEWAGFPLLAANYRFEDPTEPTVPKLGEIVKPYQIFDLDGITVAVIGMGNISSLTSIYEGGNSLGLRPLDQNAVVDEWVRILRPAVDLIVLVSHMGLDEDEGLAPSDVDDMNEDLPLNGVDLILGGHLHIVLNPPKLLQTDDYGNPTVLVHSGAFAKYVGRLDLVVHKGTDNNNPAERSHITGYTYENLPVACGFRLPPPTPKCADSLDDDGDGFAGFPDDPECLNREDDSETDGFVAVPDVPCPNPEDPDTLALLQPYALELNQLIDLDGTFAYVSTSNGEKIVRNDPSGGDSQLGNLVARSMQVRPGVDADFALTNSLGIRADFEIGPLTTEAMYNVFPFENSITVMFLSGVEIKDMLDFVASKSSERGCRSQAQVAGISFKMICAAYPNARAEEIVLGDGCRDPNGDLIEGKCAPVIDSALYRVAVNDYIAAGGSGFDVLKRNTSKINTGISLRAATIDYMRSLAKCDSTLVDGTLPPGDNRTVEEVYGPITCLDETAEAHDGRILPAFE